MNVKKSNISRLALVWIYICCYCCCCCYADGVNVTVQPDQPEEISITLSPTNAKQTAVVGQKKEKVSHDIYIQDGKSGESAAAVAHIEGTESPNQTNELTSSKSYITNQAENSASIIGLNMVFAICYFCVTFAAVFQPKFL